MEVYFRVWDSYLRLSHHLYQFESSGGSDSLQPDIGGLRHRGAQITHLSTHFRRQSSSLSPSIRPAQGPAGLALRRPRPYLCH